MIFRGTIFPWRLWSLICCSILKKQEGYTLVHMWLLPIQRQCSYPNLSIAARTIDTVWLIMLPIYHNGRELESIWFSHSTRTHFCYDHSWSCNNYLHRLYIVTWLLAIFWLLKTLCSRSETLDWLEKQHQTFATIQMWVSMYFILVNHATTVIDLKDWHGVHDCCQVGSSRVSRTTWVLLQEWYVRQHNVYHTNDPKYEDNFALQMVVCYYYLGDCYIW